MLSIGKVILELIGIFCSIAAFIWSPLYVRHSIHSHMPFLHSDHSRIRIPIGWWQCSFFKEALIYLWSMLSVLLLICNPDWTLHRVLAWEPGMRLAYQNWLSVIGALMLGTLAFNFPALLLCSIIIHISQQRFPHSMLGYIWSCPGALSTFICCRTSSTF